VAKIKVQLCNGGEDIETPWAEDLGAADGGRRVRLINVPFLHAKPTWGDEIIVVAQEDGFPVWDRDGVPWKKIGSRIAKDGGRWAMIVDYRPDGFRELATACKAADIICEGAWGPRDGEPGRAYLAVPNALDDVAVMARLRAAKLPCELIQIHPEPPKKKAAPKKPAAPKKATPATPRAKRPTKAPARKPAKPRKK
jgi:hypothetical protein